MTKVEIDGKTYCVETLLFEIDRLKNELLALSDLRQKELKELRCKGHWTEYTKKDFTTGYKCSECGHCDDWRPHYCSECGAEMNVRGVK